MKKLMESKMARRAVALVLALLLLVAGYVYFFASEVDLSLDYDVDFDGKVLIVGAGSAGLTAGYILEKQGVDFQIIEAQEVYGGRMREASDFADFPIDLGAEWIHEDPSILNRIAGEDAEVDVEIIDYSPQTIFTWNGSSLSDDSIQRFLYSEYKFKNTSWFSFFETYMVPSIRDSIVLGEPVSNINYEGDKVVVSTVDNTNFQPANTYEADLVLVTVPITVLQNNYIGFEPALPDEKVTAINNVEVPDGIKVFIEFEERFYPDILEFSEYSSNDGSQEKIYYDAAFGKDTNQNVLGLFTIGEGATELVGLDNDEVIAQLLAELDEIYDGQATQHYKQHIVQNWTSQQFIEGAYSTEFNASRRATIDTLAEPLSGKVFFAGEALSFDNQATVPGAAETAFTAIRAMIEAK